MSREIIWDDFSERKDDRNLGLDVERKMFWISRQELADASPIFKAMLYGEFEESKKEIIQLPQKSAEDVSEFLRCLFPTGTIFKRVDDDNVELLLSLSDEYEIKKLTEKCSEFLMTKIEQVTEYEKIDLFVTGVRYKLKNVVRGTIMEVRKSGATEIPGFDDMPPEVKNAITMTVPPRENRHEGELKNKGTILTDFGRCDMNMYTCNYCEELTCADDDDPCPICHSCGKRIEIEDDDTVEICQCIDSLIVTELEKVGM